MDVLGGSCANSVENRRGRDVETDIANNAESHLQTTYVYAVEPFI